MENSVELTTNYNTPKKVKLIPNCIKAVDFPYKAKQLFGLGGDKDARETR